VSTEEIKDRTLSSIRDNWKFFVLIFLIGMAYAEQKSRATSFHNLSDRVDKKIRVLYDIKLEVLQLNKKSAVEEETEKHLLYRIKSIEEKLKNIEASK